MKRQGLLFHFGIIFLIFTVVTLIISGAATYVNQIHIFQMQEEKMLQNIADYLSVILQADGDEFPMYQRYLLAHAQEPEIPLDFTDSQEAEQTFEILFAATYPGQVLGVDIQPEDMPAPLRQAYALARHEHYLLLFEKASQKFNLSYTYYVVPTGEELHMLYLLDAVREAREDGFLNLCIDVYEPLAEHEKMWEAWNTGAVPHGYDSYDNEFGKTYAWYAPLYINGVKLGLIGTEVEIADYNRAIAENTLRQLIVIGIILVLTAALTLWLIDRVYIVKIQKLARAVNVYAQNKDAAVAREIEQSGSDELSELSNQTSAMILEMDNYMKSLVQTTEELSHTKKRADVEAELARKDALTGIRNRNAYEEEVKRLSWQLAEGHTKFGFAVVDVNFLKRINDTYGHEYGNVTIRECCNAVCRVFAHSPVFRIGGDEFAVILRNEDYKHVESLVEEFNREQTTGRGNPWERFSAAIGYALYDPGRDDCVENVFRRADKAMYRRKREMKATR